MHPPGNFSVLWQRTVQEFSLNFAQKPFSPPGPQRRDHLPQINQEYWHTVKHQRLPIPDKAMKANSSPHLSENTPLLGVVVVLCIAALRVLVPKKPNNNKKNHFQSPK